MATNYRQEVVEGDGGGGGGGERVHPPEKRQSGNSQLRNRVGDKMRGS